MPSGQLTMMEDGALIQSGEGLLLGDAPEVIRLVYSLRGEPDEELLLVAFELQNRATTHTVKLLLKAQGDDFRIVNADCGSGR